MLQQCRFPSATRLKHLVGGSGFHPCGDCQDRCRAGSAVVMWRDVTLRVGYTWDPSPLAVSASHSCWSQRELDVSPGQQQALRAGVQDEASLMLQRSPSMAITSPISSALTGLYKWTHCCCASSTEQQLEQTGTIEPHSTSYSYTCRMLVANQLQFRTRKIQLGDVPANRAKTVCASISQHSAAQAPLSLVKTSANSQEKECPHREGKNPSSCSRKVQAFTQHLYQIL